MNRRSLLGGAAALITSAALPERASASLMGNCPTPSSSGVEGPFYAPLPLFRRDITEGLAGLPLTVLLRVVDRSNCQPVQGLIVGIWHSDVPGVYSAFASEGTAGETFLRGYQATDGRGSARFQTIYPGWYPGRTPHIHVKVLDGASELLTSQTYFPDPVSSWVYQNAPPYLAHGVHPVNNNSDSGYTADTEMAVVRNGPGATAAVTLVV